MEGVCGICHVKGPPIYENFKTFFIQLILVNQKNSLFLRNLTGTETQHTELDEYTESKPYIFQKNAKFDSVFSVNMSILTPHFPCTACKCPYFRWLYWVWLDISLKITSMSLHLPKLKTCYRPAVTVHIITVIYRFARHFCLCYNYFIR